MAGWASNNKFALIGAFRVVAQLLSYEVPMILSIATVVLVAGTMSTMGIVEAQQVPFVLVAAGGLHRLPRRWLGGRRAARRSTCSKPTRKSSPATSSSTAG